MADNCVRTPGSGETILADELTDATLGSGKAQFVKLMDGTLDSSNKASIDSSGHLQVDVNNSSIAGTAGSPNAGVLSVQGITSMTALRVGIDAGSNNIGDVDVLSLPAASVANAIQWSNISAYYSSAQTSADIVAASGSTKFYIGRVMVTAHYAASQAGRTTVQIYFGTSTVSDSSQHVFRGTFITVPGTGLESYPGAIIGDGSAPFTISAASQALRITTTTSGTHCGIAVSIDYIRV